jgi:hypothetical protein
MSGGPESRNDMLKLPPGRSTRLKRAATVATSVSLVLVATSFLAATGSRAAPAHAAAKCHLVVKGAPWSIRTRIGRVLGSRYALVADRPWCSAARPWVAKFTHQKGKGLGQTLKGPAGLKCHSISTAASGDVRVYAGVCGHGVGYRPPGFGWAPLILR